MKALATINFALAVANGLTGAVNYRAGRRAWAVFGACLMVLCTFAGTLVMVTT